MRKLLTRACAIIMSAAMLLTATPVLAAETVQNGWVKSGSKMYYYENGEMLKNTHKELTSYSNGQKYIYYFDTDGSLITDLIAKDKKKWLNKDLLIVVNQKTFNMTIYARGKGKQLKARAKSYKASDYNIPLRTMICSKSRKANGTVIGKNAYLEKTSATRWYIYKKSNPYHYYQWGVHIKNSNAWFHSSMYSTTKNTKLIVKHYNKLGTAQTTHCIRLQAANAKLIYDIAKNKKNLKRRVFVKSIKKSSDNGPFGKVTLAGLQLRLKSNTKKKWDPTDPNKKGNSDTY